jgi:hypothetical protein
MNLFYLKLFSYSSRALRVKAEMWTQHDKHVGRHSTKFVLIGIVGGGVQLSPLGTAATNKPIVPAPGDYGDG